MPGDLRGVRAKIARAQAHIELLDSQQASWFASEPYRIRLEPNRDLAPDIINIFFIVSDVKPVPVTFSTIIGDILYNLRSALDHLAWQLVLANRGTPTNKTAFPIRKKPPALGKPIEIDGGINPMAQVAIERLQPYRHSKGPNHAPLWLLNELCNTDKHRTLLIVGLAYDSITFVLNGQPRRNELSEPIPLIAGKPVSTIAIPGSKDAEGLQVSTNPSALIAFASEEICSGEPVIATLRNLKNEVESIVNDISAFITSP